MGFEPDWGEHAFLVAKKYLARHVWRVRPLHELDDLLQDSYLLFLRVQERYEFDSVNHFMFMWKRCLHNMVGNLALARTRRREERLPDESYLRDCGRGREREFEWEHDQQAAPREVRALLSRVKAGAGHRCRFRRVGRGRETTNQFLCRLAQVSPRVPLRRLFEMWLAGERADPPGKR